jgi:hypothetical protein
MSTTYYLDPSSQVTSGTFCTGSTTAPGSETTSTTGWVLSTRTPTIYHEMFARQIVQSNWGTTSSAQPSTPNNTRGNGFALGPFTDTIPAGTWDLALGLKATAGSGAGDVAIRWRLYKATAADGTGATELTSGIVTNATCTDLTGTTQTSGGTAAIGAVTLSGHYLIVTVSCQLAGQASSSSSNAVLVASTVSRLIVPTAASALTLTPTGVRVTAAVTSLEPAVSLTLVPDGVRVTAAPGLSGFLALDEHFPNPTPTAQGRYLALPRMSPTPASFAQAAVVFNQAAVKLESAVNEPPQRTLRVVSETLAVSTTGTTTDTSKYLLRPDAVIDHVRVLITDAITGVGVTTMSVGDGTTAARFLASASDLTLGAGYVGLAHVDAGLTVQATAAPIRLTFDATPTGGVVRLEVWYTQFLVPSLS